MERRWRKRDFIFSKAPHLQHHLQQARRPTTAPGEEGNITFSYSFGLLRWQLAVAVAVTVLSCLWNFHPSSWSGMDWQVDNIIIIIYMKLCRCSALFHLLPLSVTVAPLLLFSGVAFIWLPVCGYTWTQHGKQWNFYCSQQLKRWVWCCCRVTDWLGKTMEKWIVSYAMIQYDMVFGRWALSIR